jgi:hypothetical protein
MKFLMKGRKVLKMKKFTSRKIIFIKLKNTKLMRIMKKIKIISKRVSPFKNREMES